MSNLLPRAAKRDVRFEYWVRVVSTWMLLLAAALVVVSFLKLPTYLLIQTELRAVAESSREAQVGLQSFENRKQRLEEANTISRALVAAGEYRPFSEIVDILEELSGAGVRLESLTFARNEETQTVGPIRITGEAATRADLAAFREAVTSHELFVDINLPISNFARESDIAFSITITPADGI